MHNCFLNPSSHRPSCISEFPTLSLCPLDLCCASPRVHPKGHTRRAGSQHSRNMLLPAPLFCLFPSVGIWLLVPSVFRTRENIDPSSQRVGRQERREESMKSVKKGVAV